ncbi:MAG: molybdopterin-dependent oxidoreductase [Deltaproteobacteria bacterium]|nr:molybdopterin-dependent oxidoreductase [Deltaproteobacteria bacterium]MBW2396010.1 molybdopterin-dependent oxidoreductase [Deltaproteobacteria bacterium]
MGLSLSLFQLKVLAPGAASAEPGSVDAAVSYSSWEDVYRDEWRWDAVHWGSHTNQCAPGGCSFRVYSREGVVWREEQAARSGASNPNYPDFNPQGCQKGCGFHQVLASGERVRFPLKRVGERGEGKWKRISWDDALGEVADAILDAHENHGPESFVFDAPHIHAGTVALDAAMRTTRLLGAVMPDMNVAIGDDLKGLRQTFGKMHLGYTADNFFDAELVVLTNANPSYTWPAIYHFISEARYNGTEIVLMAPDYNATALVADTHLPLRTGTDAAFWLGVCQVIVEEKIHQPDFVREQTDLAILVRKDTGRYLRASEVDGGREDQLYFLDETSGRITEAPRGSLKFEGVQALAGNQMAKLADGSEVEVTPAFELLRAKLDREHRPEQASEVCGIHPDIIRSFARKVATKRTCSFIGFTSAKQYHGDLMERSLLLAMGLTGNWGKPGTGFNCFLIPEAGFQALSAMDAPLERWGLWRLLAPAIAKSLWMKWKDPDVSDEMVSIELQKEATRDFGSVLPTFFMYNHAGYDELWDRPEWQDPSLDRTYGQYMKESVERGYWDEKLVGPGPDHPPQVLMLMAHNPLRRERSAQQTYVEKLFPKLEMLVAVETRLSSSAMYCDIVLPAAWYYEKADMTLTFGMNPYTCLIEQAVKPQGEAKPEWEIFSGLHLKIEERAAARGLQSFADRRGETQRYSDLHKRFTMDGHLISNEDVVREFVAIAENTGVFPAGFDYEQLKKEGQVRVTGIGKGYAGHAAANEVDPNAPFYSLRWHVDDKLIYPTYARRAQFYIDHEWFLEAGEALPTHKETPPIGGMHPFRLISGHIRGSIHCLQAANPHFMRLHRGQPVLFLNDQVAAERGIEDGEMVRMFNDLDETEIMVSASAAVGKDQVVIYMWEPYQFKDWKSHDGMLVGLPKSIQLAGNYGQLDYQMTSGGPSPSSDRGLRVNIAKLSAAASEAIS